MVYFPFAFFISANGNANGSANGIKIVNNVRDCNLQSYVNVSVCKYELIVIKF